MYENVKKNGYREFHQSGTLSWALFPTVLLSLSVMFDVMFLAETMVN